MFLNKNNTLRWKWIAIAVAIVIALCVIGFLWLDAPLLSLLRRFDGAWARFIDKAFSFKAWAIGIIVALGIVFAVKIKKSKKQISSLGSYIPSNLWKNRRVIFYNQALFTLFSLFCSLLLAGAISGAMKIILGRMRPVFLEALGQTGFYPFTNDWAFNSMPSGHASASFACLVMIGLIYPKYKWLTWAMAIAIGVSRIAFGAHFPSDVLLGTFIGMVAADFVKAKV